jgi:hypothetical protein
LDTSFHHYEKPIDFYGIQTQLNMDIALNPSYYAYIFDSIERHLYVLDYENNFMKFALSEEGGMSR